MTELRSPESNYAGSHDIERASIKRFATSPWYHRYRTDDTVIGIYSGRIYPLSLGADPLDDYWHLRNKVAMFDVPEHPIEITGPDAEAFLNRLLTRDMSTVPSGRARYALACDEDGGILMDGVLIRWADDRFWYVLADGDFLGWMKAQARNFDVRITDPGVWVLQIQGPSSLDVMRAACGTTAPDPFVYFGAATVSIGGQSVLITRTGWTGELGFEVYVGPDVDHDRVWAALTDAGAAFDLRVCSLECMGIRRIEAGILDNGTDIDPAMTPFAAGLGNFVDFSKADFIGRTALIGAPRGRRLFGIVGPQIPRPGVPAVRDGVPVGRIRSGAWSPALECGVGYVEMLVADDWRGTSVTLQGVDEAFTVCDMPFLDPEKTLARGIVPAAPGE